MIKRGSLVELLNKPLLDLTDSESSALIDTLLTEGNFHRSSTWAAHMTPVVEEPAILGQLLAGSHNGNLLSSELYPNLAKIEKQLIDWFCQLFQQKHGHFTHGSTYANLEALWHAREHADPSSTIVYGSQAAHYSIAKACRILGLKFKSIATNERGEISIEALQKACQQQAPVAIVATAGTSSCGAIDDIASCVSLAREFSSWCHIDAAWGGALMLTTNSHLLNGLESANSVSFDPHKTLGQPRPCSVLLYQQPLEMVSDIDYLIQPPKQTLLGSYGGELFLPLWCSLLLTGEKKLVNQLNHRLLQAEQFYSILKERTNWWLQFSPTGIVCFRPSHACDLSDLIQQGNLSQAKINDHVVYRVIFASHVVQAKDLITLLEHYF